MLLDEQTPAVLAQVELDVVQPQDLIPGSFSRPCISLRRDVAGAMGIRVYQRPQLRLM